MLSTNVTELVCRGNVQRFIPSLAHEFHLGMLPLACKVLFNSYTGHPKL